jgi:hypothetical protein
MFKQVNDLQELCTTYTNRNIFNMDETGLFWKLIPNRTLAVEAINGGKKSKSKWMTGIIVEEQWIAYMLRQYEAARIQRRLFCFLKLSSVSRLSGINLSVPSISSAVFLLATPEEHIKI